MLSVDTIITRIRALARLVRMSVTSFARGVLRRPAGDPISLVHTIADLRPAHAPEARRYYSGVFDFAGHSVEAGGTSAFRLRDQPEAWLAGLHSFRWLRHIGAKSNKLFRSHAMTMVNDWVEMHEGRGSDGTAQRPDIVAARLLAWHAHLPILLDKADETSHRRLLRSMSKQVVSITKPRGQQPLHRLQQAMAVLCHHVCIADRPKAINNALVVLNRELDRQILPDGGHISRNPATLTDILIDLLPLRDLMVKAGLSPGDTMTAAIDRMLVMVRFFLHSSRELVQFNGTGNRHPENLAAILRHAGTTDNTLNSAPFSGYERLARDKTVLVMDTGATQPAGSGDEFHGALSFELSRRNTLFIMNCGQPQQNADAYGRFSRASAAHSTAIVDDQDATGRIDHGKAGIGGSSERRDLGDMSEINASHDGYLARYGIRHRRVVQMSKDGQIINGADRFEHVDVRRPPIGDGEALALRFHIPPDIGVSMLGNAHSVLLAGPAGAAFTFTCVDADLSLEESIDFSANGGPRKCEQIVVRGYSARNPEIRWVIESKTQRRAAKSRKAQSDTADLLQLLTGGSEPDDVPGLNEGS